MTVALRILQTAELEHDLTIVTLAGLGTLATALIVISVTAWRAL